MKSKSKPTLSELIRRAIYHNDVSAARDIAYLCRFKMGMNYRETLKVVQEVCPGGDTADRWEDLMYEVDEAEGRQ